MEVGSNSFHPLISSHSAMDELIKSWNSRSLIANQTTAEWTGGFAERPKAEGEGEMIKVGLSQLLISCQCMAEERPRMPLIISMQWVSFL